MSTANIDGGTAAWAGLVRGGSHPAANRRRLTDKNHPRAPAAEWPCHIAFRHGTAARTDTQEINASWISACPTSTQVSPALAGSLKLSGKIRGPAQLPDRRYRTDFDALDSRFAARARCPPRYTRMVCQNRPAERLRRTATWMVHPCGSMCPWSTPVADVYHAVLFNRRTGKAPTRKEMSRAGGDVNGKGQCRIAHGPVE